MVSASNSRELDLIESKTAARPFDVVTDVGRLAVEFVWLNDKTLNVGRDQTTPTI